MKGDIPQPFAIDEIRFKNCFSAPSYRIFVALVIGWVLTAGKHTVSQVILTMRLQESRHFATIYRFLEKGQWSTDWVSRCLFRILVETLIAEGCEVQVVVDDTLNKHCGRQICGAGWQHDGSAPKPTKKAKQNGYGVCFVIIDLAIRLPEISDRVFCLPYAARLWWPPKAKVKPQGLPYKTKPQLALDLIRLSHSWLEESERLRVITDLGYCCETVLKGRPKDVHVTGRLLKTSALFDLVEPQGIRRRGRPRKKGVRLPTPKAMFEDPNLSWSEIKVFCYGKEITLNVHQFTSLWYHSAGDEAVSVVLCRDPRGKHSDAVFFDTDPTASAEQIVARYAARWSIEMTNRETVAPMRHEAQLIITVSRKSPARSNPKAIAVGLCHERPERASKNQELEDNSGHFETFQSFSVSAGGMFKFFAERCHPPDLFSEIFHDVPVQESWIYGSHGFGNSYCPFA
jgi:hypothetical protein